MAYFNYALKELTSDTHAIITVPKLGAPKCTNQHAGTRVGYILEASSPNPIIHMEVPLGLDGMEKICTLARELMEKENE